MSESTSENTESKSIKDILQLIQELSQEEAKELFSRMSSPTENRRSRPVPVPYPVLVQSQRRHRRRWEDLFPPGWPTWPDEIDFPDPTDPVGPPVPPDFDPIDPGWPPHPEPIDPSPPSPPSPPDTPPEEEEEKKKQMFSVMSTQHSPVVAQSVGQPVISARMTADISRSDSDTAIPIRDVNMTLNIPADSEDKATSYISNLQRAAMDTVEIWLESNIHGSDSRDEARYSEYHFEAEELTVEVNLY